MKSKTLIATLILVAAAALISLSFPFATQTIPVTYTSYSVSYGHIQTYQLQTNSVEVACLTMESTQTVCTSDQFGFDAESWADYYCASAYYSGQNCVLVGSTTYNTNVETSSGYSVLETSTLALQEVSTNTNGPLYMSLGVSTPEFLLGSMVLLFFPIAIIVWVPIIQRKLATTKRTKEAPKKLVPNDVRVEVKTSSTPALTNGKNRAVSSGSTEKTASDWNTPLCKTCSQPMIFDAKYQGQRWLCCKDRLMFYPPQNFWYKWEDDAVVRTGATPFMDHHSRSKVNTGAMSTDTVFLAASTIARRDVIRARDSRTQSEIDYQADSKRFGGELTLSEADKRLRIDAKEIQEFLTTQANGDERGLEARRMILDVRWDQENPTTTKRLYQRELIDDTTITNYLEFGKAALLLYGEKLPTTRIWLHWKQYVIGCVPDGVADDYVYKFRASSRIGKAIETAEEDAIRQAHLYAYAFKRPTIKVHMAQFKLPSKPFPIKAKDLPNPEMTEITLRTADKDALSILSEFDRAFRGTK